MDQEYDYIVLGTGLKECILSGLLSVSGKTVLHMDRNSYYGGESASLNLEQLYKRFKPEEKVPENMGRTRDFNVDLCPKFIMSCGNLVKMLLHTKVTRYLEFRSVMGSYVVKDKAVHKVPSTATEAMSTSLMGMFQKRYFRNFLQYVEKFDEDDRKTWDGFDATKQTMAELFKKFSCDEDTQLFTGHAMALYLDDDYLNKPALEAIRRVKLYAYSVTRYGNSPYIYPLWGLGGLPEGFSRLSAIHGGVYMLNKPVDEIVYGEDGKVIGVKSGGEIAKCKALLTDPSYVLGTDKVRKTGRVARCICLMDHPIPNTNPDSAQIIMPAKTIPGRKSDIYIAMTSFHHKVASEGIYVAVIQLAVETEKPAAEMTPALNLLGPRKADFFWVSDNYEATSDGSKDNVFVTSSYDPTSHFESATDEVLQIFQRMTGKPVDLSAPPENLGTDEQ